MLISSKLLTYRIACTPSLLIPVRLLHKSNLIIVNSTYEWDVVHAVQAVQAAKCPAVKVMEGAAQVAVTE